MVTTELTTAAAPTRSQPPDLRAIKGRQQATWSAGDYTRIGNIILITGELLCEAVDLRSGQQVLDVAAGNGNATLAAARRWADVTSTDYVPALLERGRARAAAERLPVTFREADAEDLPFADASFAGAVCGGSLNEFGDPARTLRETRRVLEPGGRVAIMGILWTRSPRGRLLQRFLSTSGVRFFEPEEVLSLLDHAGLEPVELQTYNIVFFSGATSR